METVTVLQTNSEVQVPNFRVPLDHFYLTGLGKGPAQPYQMRNKRGGQGYVKNRVLPSREPVGHGSRNSDKSLKNKNMQTDLPKTVPVMVTVPE